MNRPRLSYHWLPLLTLLTCAQAQAQTVKALDTEALTVEPLAAHVPVEAAFYARFSKRERWQALVAERSDAALAAALQNIDTAGLLAQVDDLAVAALTWRDHPKAIIVCRPRDAGTCAGVLGMGPETQHAQFGRVTRHRLQNGRLWVATDGTVMILSEYGEGSTLFRQAEALLANGGQSLLHHHHFVAYLREAPVSAAGVLFAGESWQARQGKSDAHDHYRPQWLPDLESLCIWMHLGPGSVRCELVGRRRHPQLPLPNAVHPGQLRLLPPSTLAAWSQLFDTEGFVERLPSYLSQQESRLYWHLVQKLLQLDYSGTLRLREVGPRATFCVLDAPEHAMPRMAMILECSNPDDVAQTLSQAFRAALLQANVVSEQASAPPVGAPTDEAGRPVDSSTYRGQRLEHFRVEGDREVFGLWEFGRIEPVICALDKQLVVATDAIVAQRIIDTYLGSGFGMQLFETWAMASQRGGDDTHARVFLDLSRAVRHLQRWQAVLADDETFVNTEWFQGLMRYWNDSPVQLGARLRNEAPGKVEVIRVLEDRPAYWARLRATDLIIGIDGDLLSLDDAKAELKARLTGGRHQLRVERHGKVTDLTVDLPKISGLSFRAMLQDTGTAMRHLVALGAVIERVTFRQHGTDPNVFRAELLLELNHSARVREGRTSSAGS